MKYDDIKAKLEKIQDTVSVIEDVELRNYTFKKLFDASVFGLDVQKDVRSSNNPPAPQVAPSSLSGSVEENLQRLAHELGVTSEQLHTKFDFQESSVRIYHAPPEGTRVKIQLASLSMLGLIMKKVYDQSSISTSDLLKLSKLPTERLDNLNNNPDYKRKFSGTAKNLQLTWVGEKEAKEELKNYVL